MFSNLKPTFGTSANNTSFGFPGVSNVMANPFGQPAFGKSTNMGFSNTSSTPFGSTPAPLFGSTNPQQGSSLFGAGAQPQPTFGQHAPAQPSFGNTMFGTPAQPTGASLFGTPNTSSFGQQNKTVGFGFGSNTANTGFFGQQNTVQSQQPSSGLFGQNTNNLFGSNQGFGAAAPGPPAGTVMKFQLVTGTDTMVKGNINQTISTRHHCITCMKEYESKSLEELRWEDYQANRKGPQQGSQPSGGIFAGMQPVGGGLFGASSISTSNTPLFGQTDNKSVFGSTANTGFGNTSLAFGGNVGTNTSGLFGKPLGGFGNNTPVSSAFSFNSGPQTNLFGSSTVSKPFGTTNQSNNLFGQQPGFGAPSSFGSFPTSSNQNTPFSQKSNMPFNMSTSTGTGFGAFNQPGTGTSGSMFTGVKPHQSFGGFGIPSSSTPIFGQSFAQPTQTLFSSAFNKPTGNIFGQTSTNPGPGSTMGPVGTGTNIFGGNVSKPGNLFGSTPGMFNPGFGNIPINTSFMIPGNLVSQTGHIVSTNANQASREEQIISMSASPFGLSTHLKTMPEPKIIDLDLSRATNPNELRQLINVASKPLIGEQCASKLRPRPVFGRKVPIFDGLEQRDELIPNFRINSPNPKRLVIRSHKDRYKVPDDDDDDDTSDILDPMKSRLQYSESYILLDQDTSIMNLPEQPDSTDNSLDGSPFIENNPLDDMSQEDEDEDDPDKMPPDPKKWAVPPLYFADETNLSYDMTPTMRLPVPTSPKLVPHMSINTESYDYNPHNMEHRADKILETIDLTIDEDTVYGETQTDDTIQTVQTVQTQQTVQTAQTVQTEQIEQTEQTAQTAQTEQTEQIVQTEPGLRINKNDSTVISGATLQSGDYVIKDKCQHPTGIQLTRPEYYTKPTLDELVKYVSEDGSCIVKGFTIGRYGYGNVRFSEAFDVSNLNIDELVHFRDKEINIYPDESKKQPLGEGLNRKAQVTLDKVWPYHREKKIIVRDIDELVKMDYAERLRRLCEKQGTRFVEYRPDTGSWVFKVDHFSKYGHPDTDDSDIDDTGNIKVDELQRKKEVEGTSNSVKHAQDSTLSSASKLSYISVNASSSNLSTEVNETNIHSLDKNIIDNQGTLLSKFTLMKAAFFRSSEDEAEYSVEYEDQNEIINCSHNLPSDIRHDSLLSLEKLYVEPDTEDELCNYNCTEYFTEYENLDTTLWKAEDEEIAQDELTTVYFGDETTLYADPRVKYEETAHRGRCFKVGWSKNFTLITNSVKGLITETEDDLNSLYYQMFEENSTVNIIKISHEGKIQNDAFKRSLNEQLLSQLKYSEFTIVNEIPYFKAKKGFELLKSFKKIMHDILAYVNDKIIIYNSKIWNLLNALWGEISSEDMYDFDKTTIRKFMLNEWLQQVVDSNLNMDCKLRRSLSTYDDLFQILSYLSSYKLEEAAKLALTSRNPRLSLFISQLPVSANIKACLTEQLPVWQATDKEIININIEKIYMLLAGKPAMKSEKDFINVCESMNWLRSFAMYYWYICSTAEPISSIVSLYEEAYITYACAAKPTPLYNEHLKNEFDLIFHLLKYYCDGQYSMDVALNPVTHTSDNLDYSLSWFILQIFSSLEINIVSKQVEQYIHLNFASQLESMGMWHWAIFVTMFIEDPHIKKHFIQDLIYRNIRLMHDVDEKYKHMENMLVNDIHIPSSWLESAKADAAILVHNYREAIYHLLYSNRLYEMHSILFKDIVPDHFICYDYEFLENLLIPLKAVKQNLDNWHGTGEFILNMKDLNITFDFAMHSLDPQEKMITLNNFRFLFNSLSSEFEHFPRINYMHNICLAEMSSRILYMLRILFKLPKFRDNYVLSQTETGTLSKSSRDILIKELIAAIDKYILNYNIEHQENENEESEDEYIPFE